MKLYISCLTILSAFSVVALHANSVYWTHPSGRLWITASFIECFFYFAVPVFFMLSGATLMEFRRRYDEITFFKKRFQRTVVPFVLWSLIALFLGVQTISDLSLGSIIKDLVNYKYCDIYWFFPNLFACYLAIPFISAINDKKLLCQLSIVLFCLSSLIPFLLKLVNFEINWPSFYFGNIYILYVVIGYLFSKFDFTRYLPWIALMGLIGLLAHFISQVTTPPLEPINFLYKGYLNWPTVLYSSSIFILGKELFTKYEDFLSNRLKDWIFKTSSCMFGVYLIHIFLIRALISHFPEFTKSIFFRSMGAILIFIICTEIVRFVRRTRLKFFFP